jgi:hypothetical protein
MFADKMLSNSPKYSNDGSSISVAKVEQIFSNPITTQNTTTDTPQTLCITHDLVCTNIPLFLGLTMQFTQNGTSIRASVPCVGSIDVNILGCCKQHDVSLWCSQTEADLTAANATVVGCVLQQVLFATQDAYANSNNWWCKLFAGILDIFTSILDIVGGALIELINVLVAAVGDVVAGLLELVTLGLLSKTDLNNILGFGGNVLDQDLWDPNGQHQQSCLCGGTVPTTICSVQSDDTDPCRDVCKEMGKSENCYQCNYQCVFQNGKPLPNKVLDLGQVDANGNPLQPCCPGTDPNYTDPYTGTLCSTIVDSYDAPCPTCEPCNWTCKSSDGGTTWDWYTDPPANGLPCCNGIPTDQVCCDWICNSDYPPSLLSGKIITDDWGNATLQYEPPVGYSCGPVNQQDINDLSPCVLPSQVSDTNYG